MLGYKVYKTDYVNQLENRIKELESKIDKLMMTHYSATAARSIQDEIREIIDCPLGHSIIDAVKELAECRKNTTQE